MDKDFIVNHHTDRIYASATQAFYLKMECDLLSVTTKFLLNIYMNTEEVRGAIAIQSG
jgi:hypothetical protein